jgi:hypothetical protein
LVNLNTVPKPKSPPSHNRRAEQRFCRVFLKVHDLLGRREAQVWYVKHKPGRFGRLLITPYQWKKKFQYHKNQKKIIPIRYSSFRRASEPSGPCCRVPGLRILRALGMVMLNKSENMNTSEGSMPVAVTGLNFKEEVLDSNQPVLVELRAYEKSSHLFIGEDKPW